MPRRALHGVCLASLYVFCDGQWKAADVPAKNRLSASTRLFGRLLSRSGQDLPLSADAMGALAVDLYRPRPAISGWGRFRGLASHPG